MEGTSAGQSLVRQASTRITASNSSSSRQRRLPRCMRLGRSHRHHLPGGTTRWTTGLSRLDRSTLVVAGRRRRKERASARASGDLRRPMAAVTLWVEELVPAKKTSSPLSRGEERRTRPRAPGLIGAVPARRKTDLPPPPPTRPAQRRCPSFHTLSITTRTSPRHPRERPMARPSAPRRTRPRPAGTRPARPPRRTRAQHGLLAPLRRPRRRRPFRGLWMKTTTTTTRSRPTPEEPLIS